MKFTDTKIKSLRPRSNRYEVWESGGFGVRVTPKNNKSWVWVYHFQGRPRRMTFGSYPALSLSEARVKLANARKALEKGIDPGAVAVEERAADRAAESVAELVEQYLEKWARPRKRSARDDERLLHKEVLPLWGRRKAQDITRRDVNSLLDGIVARGSPVAANRTLATVRKMFNWALARDMVSANPCLGVQPPADEVSRDRVLDDNELRHIWRAAETLGYPFGPMVQLLALTGARRTEAAQATWSEVDLDAALWTVPADRMKNGRPHDIPLSPQAVELLRALPRDEAANGTGYLFTTKPDRPVSGYSRARRRLDAAILDSLRKEAAKAGDDPKAVEAMPRWWWHDFRRTLASSLAKFGFNLPVIEKILAHTSGSFSGIVAVYQRHDYAEEKRRALDAWAAHIDGLVSGQQVDDKVVRLQAAEG